MKRLIEFLRDRSVPDGIGCEADKQIEGETVLCGEPAVMMVRVNDLERFCCHTHLTLLCKEKWPQIERGRG